jgi:DNA-binding CsgD family transcriptional regulator
VTGSNSSDFVRRNAAAQANSEEDFSSLEPSSRASADSLARALDELNIAVILTDLDASVLHTNKAADDILDSRIGLEVCHGRIKAVSDFETARLRKLIKSAAVNAESPGDPTRHVAVALGANTESGIQPVVIAGFRSNGCPVIGHEAHAALFLARSVPSNDIPRDMLCKLFGLTLSEATLASQLTEGRGLGRAAKRSSMGINTARTHVKKIFSKTQTGRQAELVQLLLRSVGFVKFD